MFLLLHHGKQAYTYSEVMGMTLPTRGAHARKLLDVMRAESEAMMKAAKARRR